LKTIRIKAIIKTNIFIKNTIRESESKESERKQIKILIFAPDGFSINLLKFIRTIVNKRIEREYTLITVVQLTKNELRKKSIKKK